MFVQSLRLYCCYIILLFSPMICISLKACTCMHNSEFTQQDGRKNRTAKCLCVTNITGLLLMCFVVIFNEVNVFWWSSAEKFLKQNYCHACHTRFPVFFSFPSCCVRSAILIRYVCIQLSVHTVGALNLSINSTWFTADIYLIDGRAIWAGMSIFPIPAVDARIMTR